MKKITLLFLANIAFFYLKAQVITDTVSIGTGYSNQIWYSMENGEQKISAQSNWDLGFDLKYPDGFAIAINSANGMTVWKYPKGDTSDWNSIDTTGIATWDPHWNSVKSWHFGALGRYYDKTTRGNLDWGTYDFTTHGVTGYAIFIIRMPDGSFRKLWIKSLVGSVYTFEYAYLSGEGSHTITLDKNDFPDKIWGYYSIQSNMQIDREPLVENWDILFTTYTALSPNPHTEAAVLLNDKILAAKYSDIPNVETYAAYDTTGFADSINVIGHDWKIGSGSSYAVKDSTLYFVQDQNGIIWKLIFRAFGGITNGNYVFSKENMITTSVATLASTQAASMALYPNPAISNKCTVIYSFAGDIANAILTVTDLTGKQVYSCKIDATKGLKQYSLNLNNLSSGTYVVTIATSNNQKMQQKLVIQ